MTRQKAVTKGKELKEVNEADDPEAKAKLLRALACQKKMNEQNEGKTESNNSPQPEPSNTDPQVRSPVVTFKTDTSVTTPLRSPSTKTLSSTPSDLMKSDTLEPKARTSTDLEEEPRNISELLPISTEQDLDDINDMLGNFLGRAKKVKKKESTKTNSESMEEHCWRLFHDCSGQALSARF